MAKRYFYVFGGFGIFMVLMALTAKFEIFRKLMFLVGLGTNSLLIYLRTKFENKTRDFKFWYKIGRKMSAKVDICIN
jgi:hypothetical protein